MKKLTLLLTVATGLLIGCAHDRGGMGSQTDSYRGSGKSSDYNRTRVNDLDDLGHAAPGNMRPNGQAAVPDRSISINEGPR